MTTPQSLPGVFQGVGCICRLRHVEAGSSIFAVGCLPPALAGAKWADVRTWDVLLWRGKEAWLGFLKSECPEPPEFVNVLNNHLQHPHRWTKIPTEFTKGGPL